MTEHVRCAPVLAAVVLMAAVLVAACNSESPSTSASVAASAGIAGCPENARPPGTYRLSSGQTLTVPATITIADAWDGCGLLAKDWGSVGGPSLIGFWNVENVYTNPCQWDGALMDPPVGQTAAEFATALVDQELTDSTEPSSATLGGHPATYVRLSVPEDLDVSNCDSVQIAEFRFFKGPGEERTGSSVWWLGAADAPGLIGEIWATEFNGMRVVVNAAYFTDATQAEVDEIHGIIESIALG